MGSAKGLLEKYFGAALVIAVVAAVIIFIVRNLSVVGNVLLVLVGFGGVVLVHEFGHFILGKLSDIKVEAFSIGFPPTLAGILRTEKGWRVRILPMFLKKDEDKGESEEALFSFNVGKGGKAGETEYRLGLIPIGGYVKMLGQEDVGAAEASDDPRSFANKPVGARTAVIGAGVFLNAVSAIIIFMIVFLVGINLLPAVVGGVVPGSPADRAGLRPGDEIIEVEGESKGIDFGSLQLAAALSGRGEEVRLKVRHEDGTVEEFGIVPERFGGMELKSFGISSPLSLRIADVSDANELLAETGLRAGDRIISVNGRDVRNHWELEEEVVESLLPAITVLAERVDESGETELVESEIKLGLSITNREVKSEGDLGHICSMVPRLQVDFAGSGVALEEGDIIAEVGDVENPTYKELRDIVEENEGNELAVKVLRADNSGVEEELTVTVVPKRRWGKERARIGISLALDAEHAIVAKTISVEGGPEALEIPRGALITSVDGVEVGDFYDVISELRRKEGKRIMIMYRLGEKVGGGAALEVGDGGEFISVESMFADFVPFESLKRLYKAGGPIEAVDLGFRKTVWFIVSTVMTIKRLVGGVVSPKELMGPVGIVTLSYRIVAREPFVYYVYFLGLISACIAVFNCLPLLPFDGGQIVFLLVEKVKGSAVSAKVQEKVSYAGLVLIGALFIYITFNDIVRSFFS